VTTRARRPTPADPTPALKPGGQTRATTTRNLPPELGADAVAVLEGDTFMYSNAVGDVPSGSIGGLVHEDTRFLGRWELTINNAPLLVLSADTVDYYSAAFFLTNPELQAVADETLPAVGEDHPRARCGRLASGLLLPQRAFRGQDRGHGRSAGQPGGGRRPGLGP
jgi:hypothetical protein